MVIAAGLVLTSFVGVFGMGLGLWLLLFGLVGAR